MFVVVVGGGRVGTGLTRLLLADGNEVTLIEKSRAHGEQLAREFGDSVCIGDGSDLDVLRKAGANRADVVAAVCDRDEDNLVVCQLVKVMFMLPRTIARVADPENEKVFTALGVDATVSSTRIINSLISEKVAASDVMPILSLRGDLEIVEATVSERSPLVGKKVSDLPMPKDCRIISIVRGEQTMLADGGIVVRAEDLLYALTRRGQIDAFRKLV